MRICMYMSRQSKPEKKKNILEELFVSTSEIPEVKQNESLLCNEEITVEKFM